MQSGNWNKIITAALLGFSPLVTAQDPLVEGLDRYSSCLVQAATDDTPVAVEKMEDLVPLRAECESQIAALTALLPHEYLQPILVEVEDQAAAEIRRRSEGGK